MTHGPLRRNEHLLDRYVIVRTCHLSGMGALYEALDERSPERTRCAIKEMLLDNCEEANRATAIESFLRRSLLLTTLEHPAIPPTLDYFVVEDRTYLVMAFVEGQDLEELLARSDAPLPVEKVLRWGIELCDVLSYLHSRSPDPIIYRDLKPANIIIDPQEHIRLVDFGIAELLSNAPHCSPLGTDGYAAPEQYDGVIAPSIDIYGLGASLHHVLTRSDPRLEPPFSFERRPIREANPAVPEALAAVVMRALAYNPEDRFASAAEMGCALRQIGAE